MAVEWRDDAIVLSARPHGETSLRVSLLTRAHGRHAGLVRGGTGKAMRGLYQPGNRLHAVWSARLPDHLGTLRGEMADAIAARAMADPDRLSLLAAMCAVADVALPEREAMPRLFEDTAALLALLGGVTAPTALSPRAAYVVWEVRLLADLGFGLDLTACAATGTTEDLVYVSPRSGRAVSAAAGRPWHARLLPLPAFLRAEACAAPAPPPPDGPDSIADGLALTGYFLDRHVFAPGGHGPPSARVRLVERARRAPTNRSDPPFAPDPG